MLKLVGGAPTWMILATVSLASAGAHAAEPAVEAQVGTVFARWDGSATPGCAVAVKRGDGPAVARAFGMADLEHDVANTADTIFEAGSVSKQITAAAVVLLSLDGKLSLSDPVRKHIPELPDYGAPLTIQHLLNHTSGLRDWGTIAAAAGWPRGSRVHTHDHVLDIVTRQKSLNFVPGAEYLYSNSGYNLLAILASRVSGTSFAEFTRTRFFVPLGMKRTSWRDDHTRIVKGRAIAYSRGADGYHLEMPFENVYGNGGLLTSVHDLLLWNDGLTRGTVPGGAALVAALERRGRLSTGREIGYASGLFVDSLRGVPEISHGGATAAYRAFLARYPQDRLSLAVLCNAADANAPDLGRAVAERILGDRLKPEPPVVPLPESALAARAGLYRSTRTSEPLRLVLRDGRLQMSEGPSLDPIGGDLFRVGASGGFRLDMPSGGGVTLVSPDGDRHAFVPLSSPTPTAEQLAAYAGEYESEEAGVRYAISVDGTGLALRIPPATTVRLTPTWADGFDGAAGHLRFLRDAQGVVDGLSVNLGRVRDLRFRRVAAK